MYVGKIDTHGGPVDYVQIGSIDEAITIHLAMKRLARSLWNRGTRNVSAAFAHQKSLDSLRLAQRLKGFSPVRLRKAGWDSLSNEFVSLPITHPWNWESVII